ncbi:MAG: hypothetical protein ACU85V_20530 [Gammaproteobacteria bacterium]
MQASLVSASRRAALLAGALVGSVAPSLASALEVRFADAAWDGVTVPPGSQCGRFDGTGGSPALRVDGIPAGANALVIEFSDRSYAPMDKGGHGKLGYRLDESAGGSAEVPSAPPHTFELPPAFWTVAAHGAPGWDTAGAYLPPCSGGKGNAYYLTVKAARVGGEPPVVAEVLAETTLEMGRY